MPKKLIGIIDGGFLTAAGAKSLGVRVEKLDIVLYPLVAWLHQCAERTDSNLLRAYWYDGISPSTHPKHHEERTRFDTYEQVPAIQVRLGHKVERSQPWHSAIRRAVRDCGIDLDEFKRHFEFKKEYQQKGVDTLIVLDMLRLAQFNAYDTVLLIAGDRDLAGAVRAVQDQGKNVIIAAPQGAGVASELQQLADDMLWLQGPILKGFLLHKDVFGDE
jgi:uncharacterized LabA/DUF88 family protein